MKKTEPSFLAQFKNTLAIGISLTLGIFLWIPLAAAPAPLTSSSHTLSLLAGVYRSEEGFLLRSSDTDWVADLQTRENSQLEIIYRAPKKSQLGLQAALTVRVDKHEKSLRLGPYVKKWLKDYPKFGFEVLGSKRFRHKDDWGYVIDLLAPAQKKQMRQVVFVRDHRAVVLSCRDDQETFRASLKSCNQIIRTFAWD